MARIYLWRKQPEFTHRKQEDMISFGRLVLSLCSMSADISNYAKTWDIVSRTYSTDLQNAIMFLISPHGNQKVNRIPALCSVADWAKDHREAL
jgi:PAB-dependent poly(A)-specific ribonuclease subunit 3